MKTMQTLIAELGIDQKKAIANMNRRARHAMTRDRSKVFAGTDVPRYFYALRTRVPGHYSAHENQIQFDMTAIRIPEDTAQYVAAWCRLNHLKG